MLTRIEIDGFKTFDGFSMDLAPFTVIAGTNASGKSNLFDAIRLLSCVVEQDLRPALGHLRGDPHELFRRTSVGSRRGRFTIKLDVLLPSTVHDPWGAVHELTHTRLCYRVEFTEKADGDLRRLYVTHESVTPIRRQDDDWAEGLTASKEFRDTHLRYRRRSPLLETTADEQGRSIFKLRHDGHQGRSRPANAAEATVLSSINSAEFVHLFALAEELRNVRLLQLDPAALREPSPMHSDDELSVSGANLPTTLARLRSETRDERNPDGVLGDLSSDLGDLVPGLVGIDVREDRAAERFELWLSSADEPEFTARVASDGTLRLLGLLTVLNDPARNEVVCFEEPENGVHPGRIAVLLDYLRNLVTDPAHTEQEPGEPLNQLIVTTHSPVVVANLRPGEGVFFDLAQTSGGGRISDRHTRARPIAQAWQATLDDVQSAVSSGEVEDYLATAQPAL
jgi:predicted ATPase